LAPAPGMAPMMVPSGTPQDHIDKLRAAFAKLYKDKTFTRLIKRLGENLNMMDGPDYEKVRMMQTDEYAVLVKNLEQIRLNRGHILRRRNSFCIHRARIGQWLGQ